LAEDRLLILKAVTLPEARTRHAAKVREALGLGKTLLVTTGADEALIRSVRNLPGFLLCTPDQLNVYDILNHPHLVMLEDALEGVVARLSA
jgi:large subunit ribosomal protein L4